MDASKKSHEERSITEHNEIVGADITFNKSKHGYVLDFPWNFEEVISEWEADHTFMNKKYWNMFMNNTRAIVDFNTLFREFHQAVAMTDYVGVKKVCEPKLANHVSESLKRIR